MKKVKLTPQDLERFDAYLSQLTQQKVTHMYAKAQDEFRRQAAENHRLPQELQAANDARVKKVMEDIAAGAPYTKPIITDLWASLGSIASPTNDQQLAGWGVSTAPESYFFNWFYNMVETYLGHINQRGICVWDNATDYPINGLSQGSDGSVYRSLVSPNVNHNPVADGGTNWRLVIGTSSVGNPVGSFLFLGYNTSAPVPDYLDCLHQEVSRVTYATLWGIAGPYWAWGMGDGSTTFRLPPPGCTLVGFGWGGYPNLADGVGSTGGEATHALVDAENGVHTHSSFLLNAPSANPLLITHSGNSTDSSVHFDDGGSGQWHANDNLINNFAGSGVPHNNVQPSMVGRLLIKYQ